MFHHCSNSFWVQLFVCVTFIHTIVGQPGDRITPVTSEKTPVQQVTSLDPIHAFYKRSFEQYNSPYDIVSQYFQSCPRDNDRLESTCREPFAFCLGRCGQFNWKSGEGSKAEGSCSCDGLCPVFDDCCWDFEDNCPLEKRQFAKSYSHLIGADISCQDGFAMIERPSIRSDLGLSEREMVVSSRSTGLTFRNLNSFNGHLNKELNEHNTSNDINGSVLRDNDDIVLWKKRFVSKYAIELSVVQNIVETGELINDTALFDVPPPTLKLRACKARVMLMCLDQYDICEQSRELNITTVQVESLKSVCGKDFKQNEETLFSTPGTTFSTMQGLLLAFNDKIFDYCYARNEAKHSIIRDTLVSLTIVFAVGIGDKNTIKIDSTKIGRSLRWQALQCLAHTEKQCHLIPICRKGYLFAFSRCRHPTRIILQLVGQDSSTLTKTLLDIYNIIAIKFPDSVSIADNRTIESSFIGDSSTIKLQCEMDLTKYELEPDGNESSIINEIAQSLATTTTTASSRLQQATVCFLLDGSIDNRSLSNLPLLCGALMPRRQFTPLYFVVERSHHLDGGKLLYRDPLTRNTAPHVCLSCTLMGTVLASLYLYCVVY